MSVTASARPDRAALAMNAAIVVYRLTKRFGQRAAVEDLDFEVPVGSLAGNGCRADRRVRLVARAAAGS
jgi:hypothetical protein